MIPNSESQISVVAASLSPNVREAPRLARVAGFGGLMFDAFGAALNIPELSASGRREFLRLLSSQDQQLVGLRADAGHKGFGPGADVDRVLAQIERVLEAAKGLASPLVCVDIGPLPPPPRTRQARPKVSPEQAGLILLPETAAPEPVNQQEPLPSVDPAFLSQVDAAMAELGVRADRYGVMVAFRSELSSFGAIEQALRRANCPWFGVDLDPVAILRDEMDCDEIFSRLGALIRHVRGRDALQGADRRTKPTSIGSGDTKWGELLANLDAAGYRGWITVDSLDLTDRHGAAVAGRKHLSMFSQ